MEMFHTFATLSPASSSGCKETLSDDVGHMKLERHTLNLLA
jgi:hypothetical protein